VDLPRPYIEVYAVIGDDPREALRDPPSFEDRVSALYPFQIPSVHVYLFPRPDLLVGVKLPLWSTHL
jgi:hypothetical protein